MRFRPVSRIDKVSGGGEAIEDDSASVASKAKEAYAPNSTLQLAEELAKLLSSDPRLAAAEPESIGHRWALPKARARALAGRLMVQGAGFSRSLDAGAVAAAVDDLVGFGPLEDLLSDASITEVMVNGCREIWVERNGVLERSPVAFQNADQIGKLIERVVGPLGLRADRSRPIVDARLPDGSRFHAVLPPVAREGPVITIRKFVKKQISLEDLVDQGALSAEAGSFLARCVRSRLNVVISGGTSSGKTTLLNILSSFAGDDERIVTVEDTAELQLPKSHVVSLESRPPNADGAGGVTIRDLVRAALRMRPDRIVLGEVRGEEALDMLQAMNTGHEGSLTTVHANSPRDALLRIETMAHMSNLGLSSEAIKRQIYSAIDIVVQLSRYRGGRRMVTAICGIEKTTKGCLEELGRVVDLFARWAAADREQGSNLCSASPVLGSRAQGVREGIPEGDLRNTGYAFEFLQEVEEFRGNHLLAEPSEKTLVSSQSDLASPTGIPLRSSEIGSVDEATQGGAVVSIGCRTSATLGNP